MRQPLSAVNRTRLNNEERQERRRQLFKQGPKRQEKGKKDETTIKGVRLNKRFHVMMQNRGVTKLKPTF